MIHDANRSFVIDQPNCNRKREVENIYYFWVCENATLLQEIKDRRDMYKLSWLV